MFVSKIRQEAYSVILSSNYMAMNWLEGELKRIHKEDLAKIIAGVRGKLGRDINLPQSEEPTISISGSRETQLPLALNPIPLKVEIPTVNEEVYAKTRSAVEAAIPGVFITSVQSVTMEELLIEDKQREQRGESRRFGHIIESRIMRATLPPAMEVFIDPKAIKIEDSNSLSTDAQKARIARIGVRYRDRLPQALRFYVDWYMVDPSTLSQLEDAWMDAGNGLLLPNFFARTDVPTVRGHVAIVGRDGSVLRRDVVGCRRNSGDGNVFAVAVGVLPLKFAA